MKQYKFIFKPVFFVFNLLFATWLVIAIERVQPSDFGKHAGFFEKAPQPRKVMPADAALLLKLSHDYKAGRIDSITLKRKIDQFVAPVTEP